MKLLKKIFALLITMAMIANCFTAFPVKAEAAASGNCGDNIYWELYESGELNIYGSGDMPDFSPYDPAPWSDCLPEGSLNVVIQGDITSIGAFAFYNYAGAMSVYMDSSAVMSIGEYAFGFCSNLYEIYFPESVMFIGDYAFYQCQSLQELPQMDLLMSIGYSAFAYCYNLRTLPFGSSLTTIGDMAFSDCISLETMTVPASVTYIGAWAFCGTSLRTMTFEGNAPEIMEYAFDSTSIEAYYDPNTEGWDAVLSQDFYGCVTWYEMGGADSPLLGTGSCGDNLQWTLDQDGILTISGTGRMYDYLATDLPWQAFTNQIMVVVVDYGVEYIGREAFRDCTGIYAVIVADSVQGIGPNAFDDTLWLSFQPDGLVYIGKVLYTYKGTCPADVTIPEDTIGIAGMAFKEVETLETINFPDGLREIGDWAFHRCVNLKEIDLNEGLTRIGQTAFAGCDSLSEIVIPDSVVTMGSGAFGSCNSAEKVVIGDGLTEIAYSAFSYSESLKEIVFGSDVRAIGISAFRGCTALEQVELSEGIGSILDYAFQGCTALKSITMPKVTRINYYAFSGCSALETITLPETLQEIGQCAFNYCTSLKEITIPDSVTALDIGCFNSCTSLEEVYIGKNVSNIDSQSFLDCTALTRIDIAPDNAFYMSDAYGVLYTKDQKTLLIYPTGRVGAYTVLAGTTKIDRTAFGNCTGLTAVTLPEGLLTLEYGAFGGCTALTEVRLPDSLTKTWGGTFAECTALEKVWFGSGLQEISATMFSDCTALKEVHLPETLEIIRSSSFENCISLTEIILPDNVKEIGYEAFLGCKNLKNIHLSKNLESIEGRAFYNCWSLEEIYIPDGVTSIGSSAFNTCRKLSKVVLPQKLKYIYDYAFYVCTALTSVVLPETIQKIDASAFAGCTKMAYVKYTGTQEQWTKVTLGDRALPTNSQMVYEYLPYGSVDSACLTMQDKIGMDFTLNLSEEILADAQAYVTVEFDGAKKIIPAIEAASGIRLDVAAAQMTDPVQISVSFRTGSAGETATYTIKQLAEGLLAGDSDEATKNLAAAMLCYGGNAQKYFGYNLDDLADQGISVNAASVPSRDVQQMKLTGRINGVRFYGASLVYASKPAVRFYFAAEAFPADLQFAANGKALTPVEKDGMYYVEVTPESLDELVSLAVTDGQGNALQVQYSAMDYIVRMYEKGSDSLKELVQALYTYHITVKT